MQPEKGEITNDRGEVLATFTLSPNTLADEFRAGGRIPLIIGRGSHRPGAPSAGAGRDRRLRQAGNPAPKAGQGYTLAQKIVGKACGLPGVRPGTYCEPKMTTVGSQDTTGPMTADELKELACLGFQPTW